MKFRWTFRTTFFLATSSTRRSTNNLRLQHFQNPLAANSQKFQMASWTSTTRHLGSSAIKGVNRTATNPAIQRQFHSLLVNGTWSCAVAREKTQGRAGGYGRIAVVPSRRQAFSTTQIAQHGHLTPPKKGEEYGLSSIRGAFSAASY